MLQSLAGRAQLDDVGVQADTGPEDLGGRGCDIEDDGHVDGPMMAI